MKKEYILAILFFSGLWGMSEAVLGGVLYRADVPYASVPLTIIGFIILTLARVYFPQKGTATLIAACAMLYKFLNAPLFACHLLGIFLMGLCYDLFFNVFRVRNKSLSAAAATYLSYTLFVLLVTYIFRYGYWTQAGFDKVLGYVGIDGSMAALGCAVLVSLSLRLGEKFKAKFATPFRLQLELAPPSISALTIGVWVLGVTMYFIN